MIKVIPAREVLNGNGTVWEYLLAERGWNTLAAKDKVGLIDGEFSDSTYDVRFPALNYTATCVFPDELKLLPEETPGAA